MGAIFDPLFSGIASLLNLYYSLVPNYGIAIALLTITISLMLFPLNSRAMRSQIAMTKLQPELKQLQEKYRDDPAQQQAEMMRLFKEHGTSPLGCLLPMLVQAPVWTLMFNIIRGLTQRAEDGTFDPKYLDHGSQLYRDLASTDEMRSFGINLAENASHALSIGFLNALPFLLLIAGTVATNYWQQYMVSRRNATRPGASADDNPMQRQMQMMTKVFPLMFLVFGFSLPGALNVYFLFSALFRICQQAVLFRLHPELGVPEPAPPRSKPGGGPVVSSREVSGKEPGVGADSGDDGVSGNGSAKQASRPGGKRKKKKR